ncbi:MAG TPA: hypothetical protein VFZ65_02935 [Planctomycetota bacterium]|nr:hypothetical protein [Planctomycetota bacterium]
MAARRTRLQGLLAKLARSHGESQGGPPRDPWQAILYENVAYLCSDEARQRAFETLRSSTGLEASVIAMAPDELLLAATGHGKMAAQRTAKLRQCAQLFASVGDPRQLVRLPLAKARAALKRFPGIGDPGADRLLLFAGAEPLLALESNGLRTLLRLGYGREHANYAATYRSVQQAAAAQVPGTAKARVQLYFVARTHGQQVCRARPLCEVCAVAADCPFAQRP